MEQIGALSPPSYTLFIQGIPRALKHILKSNSWKETRKDKEYFCLYEIISKIY